MALSTNTAKRISFITIPCLLCLKFHETINNDEPWGKSLPVTHEYTYHVFLCVCVCILLGRTIPASRKFLDGSPKQQRTFGHKAEFRNSIEIRGLLQKRSPEKCTIAKLVQWLVDGRVLINARLNHLTHRCNCVPTNTRAQREYTSRPLSFSVGVCWTQTKRKFFSRNAKGL